MSLAGSVSYSDFSDLKMGKHGPDDYMRPQYVISRNGTDEIIQNPNPENQKRSVYSQINVLQKIRFKASETMDFQYNFQHSETSNIPRYDRLIQYLGGQLKYAEWYYGPQKLQLHSLKINNSKPTFLYNSFKVIAGYQNYQESRNSRKFNSSTLTNRKENLKILEGLFLELNINKKVQSFLELFEFKAINLSGASLVQESIGEIKEGKYLQILAISYDKEAVVKSKNISLAYFGRVENVDVELKNKVVEFIIRYRFEKSFITLEHYHDILGDIKK